MKEGVSEGRMEDGGGWSLSSALHMGNVVLLLVLHGFSPGSVHLLASVHT